MRRFPFLAVIVAAALIAAVFLVLERMGEEPDMPSEGRKGGSVKAVPGKPTGPSRETKTSPRAPRDRSIAIIIDDIGYDLKIVEELASIPAPIAFAVLPRTPHAAAAAGRLHEAGKDILLHLPMEPHSYPGESPGAGALMADMDERQIRRLLNENLAAVPFVSGVNNHMGSRFMEDKTGLAVVMGELKIRGLFFVDSLTSADSRGRESAGLAGIRFAARDRFIDHAPGYEAAMERLTEPFGNRVRNGSPLLLIGHPHGQTVRAIRDALPLWKAQGIAVVPIAACLKIPGGAEKRQGSDR